ncbi:RNA exonuclease 3 [Vermiconidia calcicola]|uniref:RNA exonuclease 3 n=1 Tax=Vermiconidia calcicola TaxID=1690605 RepID=A0ACC3NSM0_9PEZI|nr:RNA exonuclease 3 [Vermiconidia calcicola]
MVFTTTNLFKDIACPYGEQCSLTNCIFGHDLRPQNVEAQETFAGQTFHPAESDISDTRRPTPAKRRKVTYESEADKPSSRADRIRSDLAAARSASSKSTENSQYTTNGSQYSPDPPAVKSLPSLTKPVSPPPPSHTSGKARSDPSSAGANNSRSDNNNSNNSNGSHPQTNSVKHQPGSAEKLNPRLISNDPAGHSKRSLYLKYIHAEMVRLNQIVSESQTLEYKHLLCLSEQELVKLALDEEEKVAKDQPMLYTNIIKQRIAFYRKMKSDDWVTQIKTNFAKDKPKPVANKDEKPISTGLTAQEEVLILPHLVTDQSILAPFGYIPTPPTEAQAADAAAAVEASKNYEICDRCSARFQVFPERNEEGKLTSNGPCKHHPNKKMFPQKTKGDIVSGLPKEPYYPCCNAVVGSPGCTENEYHVFKSSSPARLAAVLPFMTTPDNKEPAEDKHGKKVKAVTFDCEMGYTVYGLELIRLTAVSWPAGEELLDVLVRPLGAVIDLNSRFSGVWPEQFSNAIPYDRWVRQSPPSTIGEEAPSTPVSSSPPIVNNPQKARELLYSFLTPKTPLIGHAIDNDLNSVRLCHPTVIDTVILFPHPRGLPMRFGLKMLTNRHLGRNIQTGGDRGHDSLEDARATGDIVRYKIGEKWKLLRATGWQIVNGQLVVPPSLRRDSTGDLNDGANGLVKAMVAKAFDGKAAGKKRRKNRPGDGATSESTEDEELPTGGGVAAYLRRAASEKET